MNTARLANRTRLLSITFASFGSLIALRACSAEPAPPTPTPVEAATRQTVPTDETLLEALGAINSWRAERGVPSVNWDDRLAASALSHSTSMATQDTLTHVGGDGSDAKARMIAAGYPTKWWAENVASGYTVASDAIAGWVSSNENAENLLSPDATHVGVGVAAAADGTHYWTLNLASGE